MLHLNEAVFTELVQHKFNLSFFLNYLSQNHQHLFLTNLFIILTTIY